MKKGSQQKSSRKKFFKKCNSKKVPILRAQKSAKKRELAKKVPEKNSLKSAIPKMWLIYGPKKVIEKGDPQKKFKKNFFKKCHSKKEKISILRAQKIARKSGSTKKVLGNMLC